MTGVGSLNPYSNGMLTQFKEAPLTEEGYKVLILILMECLLSVVNGQTVERLVNKS